MTEVTLKEHFDRLLSEMDRRIEQAYRSAEKARDKAETTIEGRLQDLNHRKAEDQEKSATYARKDEVERLLERITMLESSRDRIYGGIMIVALIGVVNLVKLFWG